MTQTAVIAIGGNSLITDREHQTVPDQYQACAQTCERIASMIQRTGVRLVITHGNGPQVGFILRRAELAAQELHMVPLDSCVADTQGALGYHIQRALRNEFQRRGLAKTAVTVVTQVLVDKNDPAFKKPNKPIGSFMSKEKAAEHKNQDQWDVVEDAGRGWRRVVASPIPKKILELDAIKDLLARDFVVVAVGGGGVAVIEDDQGQLYGAAAVIDKDLASSLLARQINADYLIISTAVEKVCLDFGKPEQKALDRMTVTEAKQYIQKGHFKPGSMLPKIQAIVDFLEGGGKEAIITDPEHLELALAGKTGTHVVP